MTLFAPVRPVERQCVRVVIALSLLSGCTAAVGPAANPPGEPAVVSTDARSGTTTTAEPIANRGDTGSLPSRRRALRQAAVADVTRGVALRVEAAGAK